MSDIQFKVSSDSRQAQQDLGQLTKAVSNIEKSTKSVSSSITSMVSALAGAIAAAGGITLVKSSADAYSNLNNKLKLVTETLAETIQVQKELVVISQRSRTSLESVGSVYSSLARSLKKPQAEILKITELIQKAGSIGGSSPDSLKAAIVQLNQGLSSGVLRGEELNSVLEQAPRLARAIADGLGVGIGQLRKLGEAGKITTESIFRALNSQAQVIEDEFNRTELTISQAVLRIKDAITFNLGRAFVDSGLAARVSTLIVDISKAIEAKSGSLAVRLRIFLTNFEILKLRISIIFNAIFINVTNIIERLIAYFNKAKQNGFGISGIIETFKSFTFSKVIASIESGFNLLLESLKNKFNEIYKFIVNGFNSFVSKIKLSLANILNDLIDLSARAITSIKEVITQAVNVFDSISFVDIFNDLTNKFKDWGTTISNVLSNIFTSAYDKIVDIVNRIRGKIGNSSQNALIPFSSGPNNFSEEKRRKNEENYDSLQIYRQDKEKALKDLEVLNSAGRSRFPQLEEARQRRIKNLEREVRVLTRNIEILEEETGNSEFHAPQYRKSTIGGKIIDQNGERDKTPDEIAQDRIDGRRRLNFDFGDLAFTALQGVAAGLIAKKLIAGLIPVLSPIASLAPVVGLLTRSASILTPDYLVLSLKIGFAKAFALFKLQALRNIGGSENSFIGSNSGVSRLDSLIDITREKFNLLIQSFSDFVGFGDSIANGIRAVVNTLLTLVQYSGVGGTISSFTDQSKLGSKLQESIKFAFNTLTPSNLDGFYDALNLILLGTLTLFNKNLQSIFFKAALVGLAIKIQPILDTERFKNLTAGLGQSIGRALNKAVNNKQGETDIKKLINDRIALLAQFGNNINKEIFPQGQFDAESNKQKAARKEAEILVRERDAALEALVVNKDGNRYLRDAKDLEVYNKIIDEYQVRLDKLYKVINSGSKNAGKGLLTGITVLGLGAAVATGNLQALISKLLEYGKILATSDLAQKFVLFGGSSLKEELAAINKVKDSKVAAIKAEVAALKELEIAKAAMERNELRRTATGISQSEKQYRDKRALELKDQQQAAADRAALISKQAREAEKNAQSTSAGALIGKTIGGAIGFGIGSFAGTKISDILVERFNIKGEMYQLGVTLGISLTAGFLASALIGNIGAILAARLVPALALLGPTLAGAVLGGFAAFSLSKKIADTLNIDTDTTGYKVLEWVSFIGLTLTAAVAATALYAKTTTAIATAVSGALSKGLLYSVAYSAGSFVAWAAATSGALVAALRGALVASAVWVRVQGAVLALIFPTAGAILTRVGIMLGTIAAGLTGGAIAAALAAFLAVGGLLYYIFGGETEFKAKVDEYLGYLKSWLSTLAELWGKAFKIPDTPTGPATTGKAFRGSGLIEGDILGLTSSTAVPQLKNATRDTTDSVKNLTKENSKQNDNIQKSVDDGSKGVMATLKELWGNEARGAAKTAANMPRSTELPDYVQALDSPEFKTFAARIMVAEGTASYDRDPFRTMFGGKQIEGNLTDHPRQAMRFKEKDGKWNETTAAGAFQFIAPTWDMLKTKGNLPDFSPESQLAAFSLLLKDVGALDKVLAGKHDEAMELLGGQFASLPSSKYKDKQPSKSLSQWDATLTNSFVKNFRSQDILGGEVSKTFEAVAAEARRKADAMGTGLKDSTGPMFGKLKNAIKAPIDNFIDKSLGVGEFITNYSLSTSNSIRRKYNEGIRSTEDFLSKGIYSLKGSANQFGVSLSKTADELERSISRLPSEYLGDILSNFQQLTAITNDVSGNLKTLGYDVSGIDFDKIPLEEINNFASLIEATNRVGRAYNDARRDESQQDKLPGLNRELILNREMLRTRVNALQPKATNPFAPPELYAGSAEWGVKTAEEITGSISEGLSSVLKGKTSFKEFGKSLLDKITGSIVDSFTKSLVESFMSTSTLNKAFSTMFADVFNLGGATGTSGGNRVAAYGASLEDMRISRIINEAARSGPDYSIGGVTIEDTLRDMGMDMTGFTMPEPFGTVNTGPLSELTDMFGSIFGDQGSSPLKPLYVRTVDALAEKAGGLFKQDGIFSGIKDFFGGLGTKLSTAFSGISSLFGGFFAEGGMVPGIGSGAVPIVAHAGEVILNEAQQARVASAMTNSQQVVNVNITGDISRQTKSEIYRMLPSIAEGVNSHNREKGLR
jgi:tape measure domain-containing protein